MFDFAKKSISERNVFFQEAAGRRNVTRLIIEKDYWVCFTLALLFSLEGIAKHLVFKGGTSLSKVFEVIYRFSEDIDLSVNPSLFGFEVIKKSDTSISRSQFEKSLKKLEKDCENYIETIVQPTLEIAIREKLGVPTVKENYLFFEVDSDSNSPILFFYYPTEESAKQQYILPYIKLEFGSLTDQAPNKSHRIKPWVADEFPEVFVNPECQVSALDAERTFWEKATILHAEFHRPEEKSTKKGLSRHYYDLCLLAEHESGRRALENFDLLKRVVEHKQKYFRSVWASYETAKQGMIRLVPNEFRLAELRRDYQRMQEMFIKPPPAFDALIESLGILEQKINSV